MLSILNLNDNEEQLLNIIQSKHIPSYRKAYSDRTAWLMACLSELAYQPFGMIDAEAKERLLQEKLGALLKEETKEALGNIISAISKRDEDATKQLINELSDYNITIEQTYDHEGTQALLVSTDNFLALVFRGTEANCFKDIKSDLKAIKTHCATGGEIHSGFKDAFDIVEANIQNDLNKEKYASKPLYITGHSLGGALATVAAKRLNHQGGIAACYTFGSPKVGNEEWSYDIKTPIYRVVNAVDCVTMVPPGGGIIILFKMVFRLIPYLGNILQKLISSFFNYHHVGDMRYLTNCKSNKYDNVKLLTAVSLPRRLYILVKSKYAKKFIKDHSISVYRKKLAIIALKRNKK